MFIIGAGAVARDGRRGDAWRSPPKRRFRWASRRAGTDSTCFRWRQLHASAASTSASFPVEGGLDALAHGEVRRARASLNLGDDELAVEPGAFVVYVGTHGDRGAHRADVILPGAAYTEKTGIYVNLEGRPAVRRSRGLSPGDAREDWAILRALSMRSGLSSRLIPFLSCARRSRPGARISPAIDAIAPADARSTRRACGGGRGGRGRRRSPRGSRISTSPTRSRAPRASWLNAWPLAKGHVAAASGGIGNKADVGRSFAWP